MKGARPGFTLVELLVAIGIICILIGVALPAVQAAREAARRAQCLGNLRQLALGSLQYHEVSKCFPVGVTSVIQQPRPNQKINMPRYYGFYSVHVRLLPWIDQQPIFNSINFSAGASPLVTIAFAPANALEIELEAINSTASHSSVSTFLCPSDGGSLIDGARGTNYRGNTGVGGYPRTTFLHPDSGNGLFQTLGTVTMAKVTDGLSQTVGFSERLQGSGTHPMQANRDFWVIRTGIYGTADDALVACQVAARAKFDNDGFALAGDRWFWEGLERTFYTHAQAPNGRIPDCLQGALKTPPGVSSARSNHPGGVNAAMADGSVRFFNEKISQSTWRALGTRNGREIID